MRLDTSGVSDKSRAVKATQSIEVEGRMIAIDDEGYLVSFDDWSPAVTEVMAEADGVTLTDDHWLLIRFLHRFYQEYEIAPDVVVLARNLCKDQQDCRWTRRYIKSIFPGGAKTACRYAGLSKPVGQGCV